MAKTIDNAKDEIASLIKHFRKNLDYVHSQSYKEVQARQDFIDPFFMALGWDVRNESRAAMQYREVIPEVSQDVEGHKRAPDYVFRVGRDPVFFVEAKKPGVQVKNAAGPAYQLRRYAWSAKLALSILTDFEELAVYECLKRPSEKDKASAGRIKIVNYDEYIDHLQEIWDIFSRDAVWSGSFDQFTQSARGKRGTSEVDSEFLKEIEGWRDELAKNLALRNPHLSIDDLNDVVQLTIDRIIFLRMAEDRGMEPYGQLRELADGKNIYKKLIKEPCRRADERYNSGLFDFTTDKLTPKLDLDDKVLKYIISDLYFPQSPYEFSVLPAEILGNVYEQFLGKVIRLTPGHFAKVEEKPEVKKAGGVYYTPAYIVEYIVKNTVGKMVEDKSPKQLEKFRVLDMACGSGSFLLGAFDYLLNHYLQWYISHNPGRHPKALWKHRDDWRLTTSEKKRILLSHIFGVDIDRQAVEVTKLSLLLKVLEGENDQTLSTQMDLIIKERALPNLDQNIKCGNSLIGPDYFTGDLIPDRDEMKRVNPFDWNAEFKEIMQSGGFDCVIGNPPYVRQEGLGELFKNYAKEYFQSYAGTADLYVYFIEKAHQLLRKGGLFGIICSNKFMRANYGKALRDFIANKIAILQLIDFGELPVFQGAATFPAIILTKNEFESNQDFTFASIKRLDFQSLEKEVIHQGLRLDERSLIGSNWTLAPSTQLLIFDKMNLCSIPLGQYVNGKIMYGIKTGLNKAFIIDNATRRMLIKEDQKSKEIIHPFIVGDDIRKYHINFRERYLIFTRRGININLYPAIKNYLHQFKNELTPKPNNWKGDFWSGRKAGNYQWYEIQDAVEYYLDFEKPKIVYPDIAKESRFAFDFGGLFIANTIYFIPCNDFYLLGLLNSKLIYSYFKRIAAVLGDADKGGRLRWFDQDVRKIPIRVLNLSNKNDENYYNSTITLVKRIIDLNQHLHSVESTSEREIYQRQINATDRQIENLVYELYGLTDEEIKIVEEG